MLNKLKQLKLLLHAHNEGWTFNEVHNNDGSPLILGAPPTSHISDNTSDLQHSMDAFSEFLTWSLNYDGPEWDFHRQYKERAQFVMVAISAMMREGTPPTTQGSK